MSNSKPFDLEAAKAGKPLVTRDGRSVTFIGHYPQLLAERRVLALVDGEGHAVSYDENGSYFIRCEHGLDLRMQSTKTQLKRTLVVYRDRSGWDGANMRIYRNPGEVAKFVEAAGDDILEVREIEAEVDL